MSRPQATGVKNYHMLCLEVNPWAIMDNIPENIAITDAEGTILYLNASWYQLIVERAVGASGFNIGGNFIQSFAAAFGTGGADVQAMENGLRAVVNGTQEQFVIDYPCYNNNKYTWFTATITSTYNANGSRGALIRQVDSTAQKQAEEALNRHNTILLGVGTAVEQLIRTSDVAHGMKTLLASLGESMGASRVYVCKNRTNDTSTLLADLSYEWRNTTAMIPTMEDTEPHSLAYHAMGFSRWVAMLSQNMPIYGKVDTFPDSEREVLHMQNIRSIAIIPIFVAQQWWGFIGIDDCVRTRTWLPSEIDMLATIANIVGSVMWYCICNQDKVRYNS